MILHPTHRTALPFHGASGALHDVQLAASSAGIFLGITTDEGPRLLHGRIVGNQLEWSAPWLVPVPPRRNQPLATWEQYEGACDGLDLTIDRHDPLRLAINLRESQGGSFGLYVGRWHETFQYVPYPHDSDIPSGRPLILRGSDLFTVEVSETFRHYRLNGTSAPFAELGFADDIHHLEHQPGRGDATETLLLGTWRELIFLQRTGAGDFTLARRVPIAEWGDQLAMMPDGRIRTLAHRDDCFAVLTYDRDGQKLGEGTIANTELEDAPLAPSSYNTKPQAVHLSPSGERAGFETSRSFVLVDLASGSQVRLDAPPPAGATWPPPQYWDRSFAIHGDHAVVASRDGVALYFLGDG